jgi:diguanylate cyclase (GGDEF)-like protein/PAS domain S-box-containing protein
MEEVEIYKRRLERETMARRRAEVLVEEKTQEMSRQALERERALRESEERYRVLVESSPDAILVEREGRVVFVNPAALHLFRALQPSDLLGRTLQSLAAPSYRSEVAVTIDRLRRGDPYSTVEEQAVCIDGALVDVAVTRLSFHYHGAPAIHMVARDISERRRLEMALHHQATHDALTGLPNRNLLVDRLHLAIAEARRYAERFMVAFIDLDRFKWINDSFGHDAGDLLLKTVSNRMSSCLRESDTIARLGGDEFVLVLRDSGNGEESMQVLNRVAACVSMPIALSGHEISVTCSMGCCRYPDDGDNPEALLRFSDAAMYRAKEIGRNNMQHYDVDLRQRFDERVMLATELRHALDRGEFALHYQLQIDLRSGAIIGIEALLRWQHPKLGNIEPARFIPIAEETGLIDRIGAWVILQACRQNKAWQRGGLMPVRVAVNVSARELARPGLVARVAQTLLEAELEPAYLELELTESASMDDPDKILPLMHALREMGVSLSIDDFGTGYSNMQYLQRFPVGKLKLDGSFIGQIVTNPGSLAITDAIVSVAHRLGMKVVAEMAETESQVALLTACGCDQVQGFFFGEPVCADECAALLRMGSVPLRAMTSHNHLMRPV